MGKGTATMYIIMDLTGLAVPFFNMQLSYKLLLRYYLVILIIIIRILLYKDVLFMALHRLVVPTTKSEIILFLDALIKCQTYTLI